MTTDRSYRRGRTHERAVCILRENAGSQFDVRVVAIFLNLSADLLTRQSLPFELRFEVEESAVAVVD
jgi:HD-GYP domain-containing protein (c-di-GMP phosphodiesterase class II)